MATAQIPSGGVRIASILLEAFILFMIILIFSLPATNHDSFGLFRITHESYQLHLFGDPWIYLSILGCSLAFLKDCINGQSITKKILKLQVIDINTGHTATPMQCFIRNITLLVFPLEVIAILAEPGRRIGDKIAGTQIVVHNATAKKTLTPGIKKYLLPLMLAYVIFTGIFAAINSFSFNVPATDFVAASFNEAKSRSLEKLLNGDFNPYYIASVRYYDSIEHKRVGYMSVICNLKALPPAQSKIEDETVARLQSLLAGGMFHGKIQFVYRSGNSMTTWNRIFGVRFDGDIE